MADQELLIRINGKATQFIDELDKVGKKTKDLQKGLTSVAKISGVGFAALTAGIGASVNEFTKFEKKFTNVVTLLDKGSFSTKTLEQGIDDLKSGVLALGADTGESFDVLNQGLFDLISSGTDAEKGIEALKAATDLATAGATDTATAVKALAATQTAFGESAGTALEISEKFFTAQKFGVTTVGELATEFNKVAGLSKELGISFDETLASLSSLTANGAKPTAVAATELRAALNSVILVQGKLKTESAAIQDALSLQNVQQRGLVASLDLLKQATGGNVVELQRLLGSSEALGTVLSLTGAQSELVQKQIAALGDEQQRAATFADALATKQETTDKALGRFTQSVRAVVTVIGEQFAPLLNRAADFLSRLAKRFLDLDQSTVKVIASILGIATAITGAVFAAATLALGFLKARAAFIAFNTTFAIGAKLTKAWTFATNVASKALVLLRNGLTATTISVRALAGATGIGLILVALSFLAADMKTTVAIAKGTFSALRSIITNFASGAGEVLGSTGELLKNIFTGNFSEVSSSVEKLKTSLTTGFKGIGEEAGDAFNEAFDKSIIEANRAELASQINIPVPPALPAPETPAAGRIAAPEVERVNAADRGLAELQAKEQEAADRISEIRKKSLEVQRLEDQKAANDRLADKDKVIAGVIAKEQEALSRTIELKNSELEALKNIDSLRAANEDLATKERLTAKEEAQLEANQAELDLLTEQLEEIQLLQAEDRALQLENEQLFEEEKRLLREENRLVDQEIAAAQAQLDAQTRAKLNKADIEELKKQVLTKRQIEQANAKQELTENVNRRNQFLKDEIAHGTAVAKINQAFTSSEVNLADQTANKLVALQGSKNKTLKSIGKAAALVQIGIDTARGAIAAYSSLAGIPFVGPALGAAAALALIAFGGEQAAQVNAAQAGGIVPPALGGARDRSLTLTEPGELIVPKAIAPDFIQSVGRPDLVGEEIEDAESSVNDSGIIITFEGEGANDVLTARQNEAAALGTDERIA